MTTLEVAAALALVQGGPAVSGPPSVAGLDVRFEKVSLETGITMHYAEQGDVTGIPVVLLHGYSDSWFSFSQVLPLLPAAYHVFALDLRGHGMTDKPAAGYGMDEMAADVVAFLSRLGLDDVTLVGHSMGAYIAQEVALAAPERLNQLVLIGTTTTPRTMIGVQELDAAVAGLADPVSPEFIREFQMSTIYRAAAPEFVDRVVSESSRLPRHVWTGVIKGMLAMEPTHNLAGSPISTMLVWGDMDTLMPRSEQNALVAMFPDVVFKVYRETGHALHWDRPHEFARDLIEFMRR